MALMWSELSIRPMTPEDAERVGSWRYSDEWSIYDLPSARPILDALLDYRAVVADGELIGFCCTGEAARVPGLAEHADVIDVGLGMDPNLVGQGRGALFGRAILHYLADLYRDHLLRAVVQSWNCRSRRLARDLGFHDVGELTVQQDGRAVPYRIVMRSVSAPPVG